MIIVVSRYTQHSITSAQVDHVTHPPRVPRNPQKFFACFLLCSNRYNPGNQKKQNKLCVRKRYVAETPAAYFLSRASIPRATNNKQWRTELRICSLTAQATLWEQQAAIQSKKNVPNSSPCHFLVLPSRRSITFGTLFFKQ